MNGPDKTPKPRYPNAVVGPAVNNGGWAVYDQPGGTVLGEFLSYSVAVFFWAAARTWIVPDTITDGLVTTTTASAKPVPTSLSPE